MSICWPAEQSGRRDYTRNVDGNDGRMTGARRTACVQLRVAFE
jgi:hypothetical protein